jgi:LacI family transcriptional regulator
VVPVDSQSRPSLTGSVRTIALDRPYGNHPFVAVDHYAGGELAARHLLALGHRRISYIAGPSGLTISARRREGFLDCCQRAIQAQEVAMAMPEILEAGFDYHAGEALAARLFMRKHDELPTAIATASDQQAIGIMRGASDYGLSIPRDLSIIGFDDIPLAGLTTPRLTTIVQPVREIAETAVAALLNPEMPQDTVLLSPTIKLRETTIRL